MKHVILFFQAVLSFGSYIIAIYKTNQREAVQSFCMESLNSEQAYRKWLKSKTQVSDV